MAKKIQSNICGMLKSFRSAASAIYGRHTPKLRAHLHVWFTRAGRRARGRLAAKNVAQRSVNSPASTSGLKQLLLARLSAFSARLKAQQSTQKMSSCAM